MLIIIASVLIIFGGCSSDEQELFELTEVFLSEHTSHITQKWFTSMITFGGDSAIFSVSCFDSRTSTYYKGFIETDIYEIVGRSGRWAVQSGQGAISETSMFFYRTTLHDNHDMYNSLYELNFIDGNLTRISEDDISMPRIISYRYYNNAIFTIKDRMEADYLIGYLEMFCLENRVSTILSESFFNVSSNVGTSKAIHDINDNLIYIIYTYTNDGVNWNVKIVIYDIYMNKVGRIYFDEIAELLATRPLNFRVFGDFLYLSNFSSGAAIGRIMDCGNIALVTQPSLWVHAQNTASSGSIELFYIRNFDLLLVLNTATGRHDIITLGLGDYILRQVNAHGNHALIQASPSSSSDRYHRYFVTRFY